MTASVAVWDAYLASRFVGYLLPASAAFRLAETEARRFLQRLTSRPNQLDLLRTSAALSPYSDRFETFAGRLLPDLLRVLPSRNSVVVRRWEGGYHGRLDIRRTFSERVGGSTSSFVTSARRRDHSLPENVLVCAVLERLVSAIKDLHQAKILSAVGWGASYLGREPGLRRVLGFSRLSEVTREPIGSQHLEAARSARHPCYREAAWWWQISEESRTKDPERLARLVSRSALFPLAEETRFELAVVVRLLEAIEARLCKGGAWRMEHCLVVPDREEVVRFVGANGYVVRVFYNQSELPAGPVDLGARHYLGQQGRMRPDVTVTVEQGNTRVRAHVFEVKLSADPGYLLGGFHEAMLYAHEYEAELTGWPKAALISSSPLPGFARREDPVIAVDWERWVPSDVVEGILQGI
jgi:hypothetical protein